MGTNEQILLSASDRRFYVISVRFVRFKGLFLNAKKNVSVRMRWLNFQTSENSGERNIITRIYELLLPFRKSYNPGQNYLRQIENTLEFCMIL